MKQRGAITSGVFAFTLTGCLLCLISSSILQKVFAYDPQVVNDLKYSRNALLRQRSELQTACDKKTLQLSELQSEIERLHKYLNDTDRSLNYIDSALSSGN